MRQDKVVTMSLGSGMAQTSPVPTVHVISWVTQHMASPPSKDSDSSADKWESKYCSYPRGVAGGDWEVTHIPCLTPKGQQLL